ncbi:MAG: hypothetical protein R2861_05625 [Desulfobacterales bacterium]
MEITGSFSMRSLMLGAEALFRLPGVMIGKFLAAGAGAGKNDQTEQNHFLMQTSPQSIAVDGLNEVAGICKKNYSQNLADGQSTVLCFHGFRIFQVLLHHLIDFKGK